MSTILYKNLPQTPGVYLMKNLHDEIIYVGKAGNLKKRVSSYFLRPQDGRISKLVQEIAKIDFEKTDTVIEALVLEANLIKKHAPKYNIKDKDDKSFLFVGITKEKFPRVIFVRGKDIKKEDKSAVFFGPFTSASSIREALRIIRKIFPYSIHTENKIGKFPRPCFDYEIGLCPGVCVFTDVNARKEYLKNVKNIKLFFEGKKRQILKNLEKEMKEAAKKQDFEKAEKNKRKIFALKHIQDIALIKDFENSLSETRFPTSDGFRIEGYDISNISGTSAVGSMVVFINGVPDKSQYRKFKIRTVFQSDDTGMLREVLIRRFSRHADDWPLPNLILIDGGKPQVNAAKQVLNELAFVIPVVGIAKGPERKKNEFFGDIPSSVKEEILISVRDEAHRFAIAYHKKVRGREFILNQKSNFKNQNDK